MKVWTTLRRCAGVFLVLTACASLEAATIVGKGPDWEKAGGDVFRVVSAPDADIRETAAEAAKSTPVDGQAALYKLRLLLRAGMDAEAVTAVRQLRTICPSWEGVWTTRPDGLVVSSIYYAASNSEAWDVANTTVEAFAEVMFDDVVVSQLVDHFLKSGWSVEQVDAWLAARPKGRENFWIVQRLRFNLEHGRGEALMQELAVPVRAYLDDPQVTRAYLDILCRVKRRLPDQKFDLTWLGQAAKAQSAPEASDIADRIGELRDLETALLFYRRAIDLPLTAQDIGRLKRRYQVAVSDEQTQANFEVEIRENMTRWLLQLGRNDEAQKWMEEASTLRQKHNLGYGSILAGAAQAASGRRTIENKIMSDESVSKSDPEYWLDRARYYQGRKEWDQEETAFKKGLLVATSHEDRPELLGVRDLRRELLLGYLYFLEDRKRAEEVFPLLRKELEQAPPNSVSCQLAAYKITEFREKARLGEEPVLWTWLAKRSEFKDTERGLLYCMLISARPEDIDRYSARVEQLPLGRKPVVRLVLGRWMAEMNQLNRALTLFEEAVAGATDEEMKTEAATALSHVYARLDDWRNAERTTPIAAYKGEVGSLCKWYADLAGIAAKAGDKEDALRLWKRAANISPSYIKGLDKLVAAGLKEQLVEFYTQVQAKMPTSKYPPRVLKMLAEK
jgi:tetratricopeptide (TPR) repeat protein